MVNLKLGIAAILLELGAWSGPLLLGGHTDSALASYLLVHALACVMLSLFLFPLLLLIRNLLTLLLPLLQIITR